MLQMLSGGALQAVLWHSHSSDGRSRIYRAWETDPVGIALLEVERRAIPTEHAHSYSRWSSDPPAAQSHAGKN